MAKQDGHFAPSWINSKNSIKGQTLSTLSLKASLKASQLSSNLNLLQSIVQAEATRAPLQSALQNYENGNNTAANWEDAQSNLGVTLGEGGITALLLQARVFHKDASGPTVSSGLLNVTGQAKLDGQLPLGYNYSTGKEVFLGDPGPGYPSVLYPNLTYASTVVNKTTDGPLAFSDGVPLYLNSSLLLGPLQVNASFALISLTVPVISNTAGNILGWLTIVIDGVLLYEVMNSNKGLRSTGIVLLVGPDVPGNQFPLGWENTTEAAKDYPVRYVLPPTRNFSRGIRHSSHPGPFSMQSYPAVLDAFTASTGTDDNEGSLLSTYNENNESVSVGYAVTQTTFCDWALLVEQAHSEVVGPLHHFRQIIIACVLGTTGGVLLISFPIAHFSVRPIRRLCAATRLSVTAPSSAGSDGSSSYAAVNEEENPTYGIEKGSIWVKLFGWRWRKQTTTATAAEEARADVWRIPGKVQETKHFVQDELTDLTKTFNEMTTELSRQYENLESRVQLRTHELEVSKKAAEAANESKTIFIANMSHELKTPLNGILGMCALCMQEEDQREIKPRTRLGKIRDLKKSAIAISQSIIQQHLAGSPFKSPLLPYVAMLSVHGKYGNWEEPGSFNTHLSALVYCGQLWIFRLACEAVDARETVITDDESNDGLDAQLETLVRRYFANTVSKPLAYLLLWRRRLFGIAPITMVNRPATWNIEKTAVSYQGISISMNEVRQLCRYTILAAQKLVYHDLMFGIDDIPKVTPKHLDENDGERKMGWWFGRHQQNAHLVSGREHVLVEYVARTATLREMYLEERCDQNQEHEGQSLRWQKSSTRLYQQLAQDFLKNLAVAIHFSAGPPVRASEFLSPMWHNTEQLRHIQLRYGKVLIYLVEHKMMSTIGKNVNNIRFLCDELGELLMN
ncbi:Histidine kinase osmosensor [Recurvomyces mirabilis]|nr:Histidine kinase osmosensor [Recurvomyces mirabilis]